MIHCEEMLIIEMEKITYLGTFLSLQLWNYCELSHSHVTASLCFILLLYWRTIRILLSEQYLNFNSISSNILFSLISFLHSHVSLDMSVTKFSDTSFIDINFDQYQHFRCFHLWFLSFPLLIPTSIKDLLYEPGSENC